MERQTLMWSVNSAIRRSWHRAGSARTRLALKTASVLIGLSALGVAAAGQTAPFLFLGDRGAEATASLPAQSLGSASQLAPGLTQAAAAQTVHAPPGRIASYLKMPLRFEVNQGQTDKRMRFISRGLGYTLFLTSRKAVLVLAAPAVKQGAPGERLHPLRLQGRLAARRESPGAAEPVTLAIYFLLLRELFRSLRLPLFSSLSPPSPPQKSPLFLVRISAHPLRTLLVLCWSGSSSFVVREP